MRLNLNLPPSRNQSMLIMNYPELKERSKRKMTTPVHLSFSANKLMNRPQSFMLTAKSLDALTSP
jgi:hypothetical protein